MLLYVIYFLAAVIAAEATTEIVVKSYLFRPVREALSGKFRRLHKLVSCPHCFSLWASFLWVLVVFFSVSTPVPAILLPLAGVVVHRCSNYLHMVVDRYLDKFYIGGKQ